MTRLAFASTACLKGKRSSKTSMVANVAPMTAGVTQEGTATTPTSEAEDQVPDLRGLRRSSGRAAATAAGRASGIEKFTAARQYRHARSWRTIM
jgi:hypothetical protein